MTQPTTPEPTIPDGGDISAMTFEQALFATTGGGIDLHAVLKNSATADDGWFTMGGEGSPGVGDKQEDGQSGGSGYSYHAWDKWYVSVDWNQTKTNTWSTSVEDVDKLIQEMQDGKSGKLDVNMLWGAKAAVDNYVNWLTENQATMQNWVNKLTSDDSAFKGKAAHAIRQSLDNIASSIEDLRTQIVEERATSQGLETVAHALNAYIRGMTQIWYDYVNELRTIVHNTMNAVVNNVGTYMRGMGLYHDSDNYVLDMLAAIDPDNRKLVQEYIKYVVDNYASTVNAGPEFQLTTFMGFPWRVEATGNMIPFPPGPLPPGFGPLGGALDNKNTWNDINTKISNFVMDKMEPMDIRAREVITSLESAYNRAKDALLELEPPTPLTPGGGGGGGGPNPWDILNNQPPPGGGGGGGPNPWDILNNQPPPGGGGGGGPNPWDILNNQPPPGGGGGGGNNNPFDILNNQPPPGGGGGGGGSDNPFNSLSNQPPPGGGGSDNPFSNLPGDNAFSNNPGGGGGSGTQLPPFLPPGGVSAFTNGGPNGNRPNGFQLDANGNPIGGNGSGDFQTQSNLPGNNSNLPDFSNLPGGGGDFSNLPGGNGDFSNLPGGGGDLSNLPGGNGRDFTNLPGGGGDFSNLPGGGGDFSNLPGGNGDFSNLPGGGGDFSNLPGGGGDFSNLPGGGGDLSNLPGGGGDFSNLPGGGGDFSNLPGGGGDLGGLPGGGAGGGTPGGGAGGGFGGEGWSDWSGQQDQSNGGNGSPFSSSDSSRGMGGMPMMPPMMPPGNQGDSKERERQTWLSEDDKVWGTDSFAGSGVIGLPSDLVHETDEPLAPTHVHVSTAAPRSKPADQKPAEETTERAEQTATT